MATFQKVTYKNASPRGTGDLRLGGIPAKAQHLNNLIDSLQTDFSNRLPLWAKSEVITDDGDGTRTLTAAETNTIFVLDDAALILVLPTVSAATVGVKYKIVIAEEETTAVTIKTQGNTHYMSGFAIVTADAAVPQLWAPDGNSESEINLNGGTTGGKGAGVSGDTGIVNEIVLTCISASAGAAWHVEAYLHGDGTLATPFADQ